MSSFHAYLWASDQNPGSASDKVVLLALAWHCNDGEGGGNMCFPGQETIAKWSNCSVDTVRRSLARLSAGGYIKIKPEKDATNGQRLFDRYFLQFEVTTKAPDGSTVTHRANCKVEDGARASKSPRHAQDAQLGEEAKSQDANCKVVHHANHLATHDANHLANHPANCGPNLIDEDLSSTARAGACEAGAAPARAQGRVQGAHTVRRGDPSWQNWIDVLAADVGKQAAAAGVIEVSQRWPDVPGARLLAIAGGAAP